MEIYPIQGIDGLVLSKFDTVDNKVGAAISMVYSTGQPIVFVGVGQRADPKILNVQKIVDVLICGSSRISLRERGANKGSFFGDFACGNNHF
jgi:flagellar biosynthesis GTPase FlhF